MHSPSFTRMVGPALRVAASASCLAALALGAASLACGGAESGDGLPLLTISECQELGGAPLFDPEDERPLTESCPEGLYFVGEFDEEFFGADGGICCTGAETAGVSENKP
jgi:hypothetical protein